jgi:L-lactate dehydrogenase (cytochrome)
MSMPVALGPVGMAGMYARRGEVQAARAAHAAGVPFTLSTVGVCDLAEVVGGAGVAPWFQLYMIRDRGYMQALLETARDLGCPVLVFTVDLPVLGSRYRDVRSGLSRPASLGTQVARVLDGLAHPAWLIDVQIGGKPHVFGNLAKALPGARGVSDFGPWVARNFDPSLTWKDLDWIRQHWAGPIVIKGVLDPEDAKEAVRAGADGLVVSNHGGRQLDGVLSGIAALLPIVDAVGDKLTVLMDGGVRSGLDVVKALALGAKGVLLGRAWAWALGGRGQAGVAHMLEIIRQEMLIAMMLTGCTDVREAGRELLVS